MLTQRNVGIRLTHVIQSLLPSSLKIFSKLGLGLSQTISAGSSISFNIVSGGSPSSNKIVVIQALEVYSTNGDYLDWTITDAYSQHSRTENNAYSCSSLNPSSPLYFSSEAMLKITCANSFFSCKSLNANIWGWTINNQVNGIDNYSQSVSSGATECTKFNNLDGGGPFCVGTFCYSCSSGSYITGNDLLGNIICLCSSANNDNNINVQQRGDLQSSGSSQNLVSSGQYTYQTDLSQSSSSPGQYTYQTDSATGSSQSLISSSQSIYQTSLTTGNQAQQFKPNTAVNRFSINWVEIAFYVIILLNFG